MPRIGEELKNTDNRSVLKKAARHVNANHFGKCEYCFPHSVENVGRRPRPDSYKNHGKRERLRR